MPSSLIVIGANHPYRYTGDAVIFRKIESLLHSIWDQDLIWTMTNNNLLWISPALSITNLTVLQIEHNTDVLTTVAAYLKYHISMETLKYFECCQQYPTRLTLFENVFKYIKSRKQVPQDIKNAIDIIMKDKYISKSTAGLPTIVTKPIPGRLLFQILGLFIYFHRGNLAPCKCENELRTVLNYLFYSFDTKNQGKGIYWNKGTISDVGNIIRFYINILYKRKPIMPLTLGKAYSLKEYLNRFFRIIKSNCPYNVTSAIDKIVPHIKN